MLSLKNTLKENPKLLVIFGFLVLLFTVTSLLQPSFRDPATLTNTMRWIGLFGIISMMIDTVVFIRVFVIFAERVSLPILR